jgi:hypothetical protein
MKTDCSDPVALVTLKSYGDFLIAYRALLNSIKLMPERSVVIITGRHIHSLAEALEVPNEVIKYVGDISLKDVPPAFDVRRCGLIAAAKSLISLRMQVHDLARPLHTLIFDRLGAREKFIAGRFPVDVLPATSDNIYLAYDNLLGNYPFIGNCDLSHIKLNLKEALIVPASRIERKVLPKAVIFDLYQQLKEFGVNSRVLLLEGECVNVPPQVPVNTIPRQFSALISALKKSDLVVSADSLPAHLGDYLDRPTFVVSPQPNHYWLPRTAYRQSACAHFEDLSPFKNWLQKYFK